MADEQIVKNKDKALENRLTNALAPIFVFTGVLAVIGGVAIFIISMISVSETTHTLLLQRAPAIFGLPIAVLVSFFIVSLLKQTSGPIEFTGSGLEFKGTSGQVVLWLMCFLGIALMIKLLWGD
jgi:hypothetical protein